MINTSNRGATDDDLRFVGSFLSSGRLNLNVAKHAINFIFCTESPEITFRASACRICRCLVLTNLTRASQYSSPFTDNTETDRIFKRCGHEIRK